jgi:hypothetical protein
MSTDGPATTAEAPSGRSILRSIIQGNPQISVQDAESHFKTAMMGAGTPNKKFDKAKFYKERRSLFPDMAAPKAAKKETAPKETATKGNAPSKHAPRKKVSAKKASPKKAAPKKASPKAAPADVIPYTESWKEYIFAALAKNEKANAADIQKSYRASAAAAGVRNPAKLTSSNFFRIRRLWMQSVGKKIRTRRKTGRQIEAADEHILGPEAGPRSRKQGKLGRPFGSKNRSQRVIGADADASLEQIEALFDQVVMKASALGRTDISDSVRLTRRAVSAELFRTGK